MKEIIIATNNAHKVHEYSRILGDLGYKVLSLKDINLQVDVEENGTTFKENAIIKAKTISEMINKWVISDDSGLEIMALDGFPGIESARFAGHGTSYDIKNNMLLEMLKDKNDRSARYVCAIALAIPNRESIVVEGYMEGSIAFEPKGENGFGYDPIFMVKGKNQTAAELSEEEKNTCSHRYLSSLCRYKAWRYRLYHLRSRPWLYGP